MIYQAKELNRLLTNLALTATDGKIEFIGTAKQWQKGDSKCELCQGEGYYDEANGPDDFNRVKCLCWDEGDFTGVTNEDR
jgi:hypothetical protein